MNKIAVAVCDTDREYRDRFVTYLVERKAEEYAVSAFSMPEKLLEALEEKKPDLAICGTGFEEMAERLAGYDIPVLVLQETMADAGCGTGNVRFRAGKLPWNLPLSIHGGHSA